MAVKGVQYKVLDEATLGYINEACPHYFNPYAGYYDWKNGPVYIDETDDLRDATLQDFDQFRVDPKGHII